MDRYYIREALVHDYHARALYPKEDGNRRLLAAIHENPRLHPVWVLEPPLKPGRSMSDKLVDEMLTSGVRVARLRLPSKGVLAWVWEDLFTALEAHRIPCFLDFGTDETTLGSLSDNDLGALHTLVQKHPEIPLILSHVMGGLGVNPGALYLIHRSENLHIDITGILEYWRKIAYQVGPERVLFATGMPFTDPGILVSNVQYALDLDEKAKKMICGDNLRRLIGGVI
jgi:predicted TIM-barrel fold metal-dependent hydrolase